MELSVKDEVALDELETGCPGNWEKVDPDCLLSYRMDYMLKNRGGSIVAGAMKHEVWGYLGKIAVGTGYLNVKGDSFREVASLLSEQSELQELLQ